MCSARNLRRGRRVAQLSSGHIRKRKADRILATIADFRDRGRNGGGLRSIAPAEKGFETGRAEAEWPVFGRHLDGLASSHESMPSYHPAMTTRRAFTDAETWAILTASDSESAADRARRLGRNEHSVRVLRARLRRDGWTCAVAYRPCQHCGKLFTVRGVKAGRAAYHPACRRLALVEIGRRNDQDRWDRLTETERRDRLERVHRHSVRKQAMTRPKAFNHGRRWDPSEDAVLLAPDAPPNHVLAEELGRTLYAVMARYQKLRARQKPS